MESILVISPHQDDEVLGCGGSIAKKTSRGAKVTVVYITAGFSSVLNVKSKKKAIEIREKEAIQSCKVLGIKKWFFLREEDRSLIYNKTVVRNLVEILRKIKPDTIYLPHPEEADLKHRLVSHMSQEALWMAKSQYFPGLGKKLEKDYKMVLFYEVWTPIQSPAYIEDITEFKEKKIKAMQCYASQLSSINLIEAVLGLNRYRGEMFGKGIYAEAFGVKMINI